MIKQAAALHSEHCIQCPEIFVLVTVGTMTNPQELNTKILQKNEDLMHLIYDYFTGQLEGYTYEEAKRVITSTMWSL